jgi:ankyrin repeat protein
MEKLIFIFSSFVTISTSIIYPMDCQTKSCELLKDYLVSFPLHKASENGDAAVIKLLLNQGQRINQKNIHGQTPLHKAAAHGHIKVVEILLANHAQINIQDIYGETPLHKAVQNSNCLVVKLLLNHGADHRVNKNYQSPCDIARTINYDVLKVLEDHWIDSCYTFT